MARPAKIEKEVRNVQCPPGRLKLMTHAHNYWAINAPAGAEPADIETDSFWSLMSQKIRAFDRFEVLADDGTWLVQGIIKACGSTWAKVHIIQTIELGQSIDPVTTARFRSEWRGPENLWCVIRVSDGAVIHDKLDTAATANKLLAEHDG
jgi:hypothetical protein